MSFVTPGIEYFADPNQGRPVANGYVYIGTVDTDPTVPGNQLSVSARQEDGSVVTLTQPIRTNAGGIPVYNGSPVQLLVLGFYSITVLNSLSDQVYYFPTSDPSIAGSPLGVISFETYAGAQAHIDMVDGQIIDIGGRTTFGDGGGGQFYWNASDLSASVTADTQSGIYVAPDSDATGASGAWVRQYSGPVNVAWFGAKLNAELSVGGSLTGDDDTTAINSAIALTSFLGLSQVNCIGRTIISDQIDVLAGVTLYGGESVVNPVWRIGTGWEGADEGSIIFVDFGNGVGVGTYASAAIQLNDSSQMQGYAFNYPGQDMTATTPAEYPPTIAIATSAQGTRISKINLGNAYCGIDARRDHTNLFARDIVGYPLAYGIRIGGMVDQDYPDTIHFQPLYGYRGTPTAANSLVGWVNENGIAVDLGRNSFTEYTNIFGYGYAYGVNAYYQTSGTPTGNTWTGGTQRSEFRGCSWDQCRFPYHFDAGAESGNTHFGVKIIGGSIAAADIYNPAFVNTVGVVWNMDAGAGLSDLILTGGLRLHGCSEHGMRIQNAQGVTIDSSVHFESFGVDSGGVGVILLGCTSVDIDAYLDGQNRAGLKGVFVQTGNSGVKIAGRYKDFLSEAIQIDNDSNEYYFIQNPLFDDCTLNDPIKDNQVHTGSYIGDTRTTKAGVEFLSDGDVTAGVLALYSGQKFVKYTGTTTIDDISDNRIGREVVIRFNGVATITHGATIVLQGGVNFATTANDTLTLIGDGSTWFEVSRSVN